MIRIVFRQVCRPPQLTLCNDSHACPIAHDLLSSVSGLGHCNNHRRGTPHVTRPPALQETPTGSHSAEVSGTGIRGPGSKVHFIAAAAAAAAAVVVVVVAWRRRRRRWTASGEKVCREGEGGGGHKVCGHVQGHHRANGPALEHVPGMLERWSEPQLVVHDGHLCRLPPGLSRAPLALQKHPVITKPAPHPPGRSHPRVDLRDSQSLVGGTAQR